MAPRDFELPDGVSAVVERPTEGGFPEVIWIFNDDDDEGAFQDGDVRLDAFIPQVSSDEEDEAEAEAEEDNDEDIDIEDTDEEDTEDEDTEDEDNDMLDFDDEDWRALESEEDSGYGSMSEEEEEDVEDEEEPPAQPVEHPEDLPPVSPRSEDSASPASSLSSSTKRSREDSDTPQVSGKRQRKTCEDCDEEPRPSTSGHSSSTQGSGEEDYRNSAPSTSGSSSSMPRRYWPSSFQYPRRPDDSDSDED
ncbi:hypothetical protein ABVT39_006972 [Epinephelus coioides]